MMQNKPIILCGSGNSISDGIEEGLFDFLDGHITIGLNRWFKYAFEPTFTTFVDWQLYRDYREQFKSHGLIIGKYEPQLKFYKQGKKESEDLRLPNTILLPKHNTYYGMDSWRIWDRECLRCGHKYQDDFTIVRYPKCPNCDAKPGTVKSYGFYSGHLCGLFALTLAIALGFKEIYLLGYDCCQYKGKTHFWQDEINMEAKNVDGNKIFSGVGVVNHKNGSKEYRTSTYNDTKNLNDLWYSPYKTLPEDIKIYNVSPVSKLNVFPKINYQEFFEKCGKNNVNQDEIRAEIRAYINDKTKK